MLLLFGPSYELGIFSLILAGIELLPVEFMYSKQGLSSLFVFRDEVELYEPFVVIPVGLVRCYTSTHAHQLVVMLDRSHSATIVV
jgi:hypothetical protein